AARPASSRRRAAVDEDTARNPQLHVRSRVGRERERRTELRAPARGRIPRPADRLMSCNDCNRSDLFRRAAAEAGRGLPMIEPGMPVPAGTGMSRRSFLVGSSGLALAVFGGSGLLSSRMLEEALGATSSGQILVSVFLAGGADTLSVLFPAG